MAESEGPLRQLPVAEADVIEAVEVAPDQLPVGPARRRHRLGVGLVAALAGLVLLGTVTVVSVGSSSGLRLGVLAAAVVLLYVGASNLGRYVRGERFDLALVLSMVWMVGLVVAAVLADWLPLAESKNIAETLTTPTLLRPDLFSEHPLGTDRQGLDILGGIVYGARVSLVVSFGAVLIGMLIGGVIGIVAGYYRGRTDSVVGLLADSMLAFPPLILLLAVASVLNPSTRNVTLALAVLGIPIYVRLSRATTIVFAQREFVLAARVLGVRDRRIIFRDVLPNVALPLASYGFIVIGALIVAEASLSFLGLSIPRPQPTWGNMIAAGQDDFDKNPHLVFVPSAALFLTVFALNRIGERARELWDPRGSRL